ncbi:MAG: hypothetical protein JNL62_04530 [Bryobacterales bacterium]|nr:hypothetical protein [Bryobacterales bacterium]
MKYFSRLGQEELRGGLPMRFDTLLEFVAARLLEIVDDPQVSPMRTLDAALVLFRLKRPPAWYELDARPRSVTGKVIPIDSYSAKRPRLRK